VTGGPRAPTPNPPHLLRTSAWQTGLKLSPRRSDVQRATFGVPSRQTGPRIAATVTVVLKAPDRAWAGGPLRQVPDAESRQRSGIRAATSVEHLLVVGVDVIDTPNVLPAELRRHPQASYLPVFLREGA
jgi:hypothetical protein